MRPTKPIVPSSRRPPRRAVKSRYTTAAPELPDGVEVTTSGEARRPGSGGAGVSDLPDAGPPAPVSPAPPSVPEAPRRVVDLREAQWVVETSVDGSRYRRRDVRR